MMDFASITYLPDTRSKSKSNLEMSLTKDFTLSIELREICTVFHVCNPPCYLVNIIYYPHLTALSYRLEGKKSMRKHTKIKWNLRDF